MCSGEGEETSHQHPGPHSSGRGKARLRIHHGVQRRSGVRGSASLLLIRDEGGWRGPTGSGHPTAARWRAPHVPSPWSQRPSRTPREGNDGGQGGGWSQPSEDRVKGAVWAPSYSYRGLFPGNDLTQSRSLDRG